MDPLKPEDQPLPTSNQNDGLPLLTPEDIEEIEQEPGDVNDIPIDHVDKEKLDQLRSLIANLPRDQAMQLIENLAQGHANPVNPNNNTYSNTNKKEMLRYKLQQKIRQKQVGRSSKVNQLELRRKHEEKLKAYQEQQAQLAKQQKPDEASEIHVHNEQCNHDHTHDH